MLIQKHDTSSEATKWLVNNLRLALVANLQVKQYEAIVSKRFTTGVRSLVARWQHRTVFAEFSTYQSYTGSVSIRRRNCRVR